MVLFAVVLISQGALAESIAPLEMSSVNTSGNYSGNGLTSKVNRPRTMNKNGTKVAFVSYATDLVENFNDGNAGNADVFIRHSSGITELVSVASGGGVSGNHNSGVPSISADGRYVVFQSWATDLVGGITDTNGMPDIFVKDLQTGVTQLVSIASGGGKTANNRSDNPFISDDGRYVGFESDATDLVVGGVDGNTDTDTYVRDIISGTTYLASIRHNETTGVGDSWIQSISADGKKVLFQTRVTDMLQGIADSNGGWDLYVRDIGAGTTELVTINSAGNATGNMGIINTIRSEISANGRFAVWATDANNLGPADTNGAVDVYLRDLQTDATELISSNFNGNNSSNDSSGLYISISANGRYIAFESFATDLVAGLTDDNGRGDIFIRDIVKDITKLVTIGTTGSVANSSSEKIRISPNGRFVSFESNATNLVTDPVNAFDSNIYIRDTVADKTYVLSNSNHNPPLAGNGISVDPEIEIYDRQIIANFKSTSSNLLAGVNDNNFAYDIFYTQFVIPKFKNGVLTRFYTDFLDRAPDNFGYDYWEQQITDIRNAGAPIRDAYIVAGFNFTRSQEYQNLNRTNRQFVEDLFLTYLDRIPTNAELDTWEAKITGSVNRDALHVDFGVTAEFQNEISKEYPTASSPTAVKNLTSGFYRGLLHRNHDSGGWTFWLNEMQTAKSQSEQAVKNKSKEIGEAMIFSDEFKNAVPENSSQDAAFVNRMYEGYLRRAGDASGISYWTGEMVNKRNAGKSEPTIRSEIIDGFIATTEFQTIVNEVMNE